MIKSLVIVLLVIGSSWADSENSDNLQKGVALPAPPNLTNYRGKNGQTFLFTITGATGGHIWGTHIYSDDSSLAKAAVHAGMVKVGEKKNIRVTIVPGQSAYLSCTLNGITSTSYGAYRGSFRFTDDDGQGCDSKSGALPAPSNLTPYRSKNGQTFVFTITGAHGSSVWGAHTYTDDSSLAAAAVHAGVVRVGETKNVRVTIRPGQFYYLSCTLNGIKSSRYGAYPGSFEFPDDVGENCECGSDSGSSSSGAAIPAPGSLTSYRGKNGQTFLFIITGVAGGSIWGTHIYTDDSSLARAAVQAGLVKVGETKNIRVTILPGQSSYLSCTLNGVSSTSYGAYRGSFRFTDDDGQGCNSGSGAWPAPPNLTTYRGKNGQTFVFTVTGALGGSVWGTHTYTDDSSLATAAVHAGVVRVGETKNVPVTIRPGQFYYLSCTLNGIKSLAYVAYSGSFEFPDDVGQSCECGSGSGSSISSSGTAIPAPGSLSDYRGKNGQIFLFTITGVDGGFIWGSHNYTDDSSLAKAAVHAGLVKVGETKNIRVTILPGQSSYLSCTLNGITSLSYGAYSGSFRFTDDDGEGCSPRLNSGDSGFG